MIVGLGNPGREYENTKHNTGFMTVDALAADMGADRWQQKMAALVASVSFRGETILLVKPQTYMNDSGRAVGPLMRWYKLADPQVYIVYDDMDLPVGRLRIRKSGSDGGHNGIKSIFANGCTDFIRFRIGIGRPLPQWSVVDHVLAPFTPDVLPAFQEGVAAAVAAIKGCLELGVDKGMNRFNPKKKRE